MEASSVDTLPKQGRAAAAKAADMAADMAADLSEQAAPMLRKASNRTHAAAKRGMSALADRVSQGRDAVAGASDSILAYTKKNPAKALAIAAIAGALLFVIAKANVARGD